MNRIVVCIGLLILAFTPFRVGAEIYRWVDDQGQVHYQDRSRDQAERGERGYSTSDGPGQPLEQRLEKTHKLLNAYEAERQQARDRKAQQEKEVRQRKRRCAAARDNLRRYSDYGRIYRLDDEGNRVYASDEQRAALITRSRQRIAKYCDD